MSVREHIPNAPIFHLHLNVLSPVLAGVALIVLLGLPALNAPSQPDGDLDWHGNSASAGGQR